MVGVCLNVLDILDAGGGVPESEQVKVKQQEQTGSS